jgi:hypothetical protein
MAALLELRMVQSSWANALPKAHTHAKDSSELCIQGQVLLKRGPLFLFRTPS